MATNRARHAGFGTHPAAVAAGQGPPYIATTEEFNVTVNTITAWAWANGGTYPTATFSATVIGNKDAALGFAGYNN